MESKIFRNLLLNSLSVRAAVVTETLLSQTQRRIDRNVLTILHDISVIAIMSNVKTLAHLNNVVEFLDPSLDFDEFVL